MSTSTNATDRSRPRRERPAPAASSAPAASFSSLGVPAVLAQALAEHGISATLPIQSATIPDALAGRDILGRGRTGSGKTIAYAVPVVANLAANRRRPSPRRPRALVLVPTRELAAQVTEVFRPLAQKMGLRTVTIYGGVPQNRQVSALRQGVDVAIATPGRLEDLIQQGHCQLGDIAIAVIDEADHMADLGFLPVVNRLLEQTPPHGQRLLFSATLDRAVDGLVARHLHNAATHSVDPVEGSPDLLEYHVFSVQLGDKAAVVNDLASGRGRTLLFTRTKYGAKKLARQLANSGIPAVELHGNLSQSVRQRNLAQFIDGSVRVLVATDIAARGIHVDDIALVVHVDPPAEHKTFLHRSGRTARAGAAGAVVTVVTPDQAKEVRTLVRQAGIHATTRSVVPGDPQTAVLTGPPATRRATKSPAPTAGSADRYGAPSRRTNGTQSGRQSAWAPRTRRARPMPTSSPKRTSSNRASGRRNVEGGQSMHRRPR